MFIIWNHIILVKYFYGKTNIDFLNIVHYNIYEHCSEEGHYE